MTRPIPRALLIHEASHLHGERASDDWGNITYDEEQALTHIRVEPTSKIVKFKENTELQLALLLFFDCVNSEPKGLVFDVDKNLDDRLIFNGISYTIKSIAALYDRRKLHHYEIGLV